MIEPAQFGVVQQMDSREAKSSSALKSRVPRWKYWLGGAGTLALALLLVGAVVLHHYWPFTQEKMQDALRLYPGTVHIARLRPTIFPFPGCVMEGVSLTRNGSPAGTPPLFTADRLTIQAGYADLFLRPGYIARITLEGLRVHVPAIGTFAGEPAQGEHSKTRVGRVVANGSVLEIARQSGEPLRFNIATSTVDSLRWDAALTYRVSFHNPLPPGDVVAAGQFGPWNSGDAGQTPVSGQYAFDRADLGIFAGVAGTLSSKGEFFGPLGQIAARGAIDVPDFEVARTGHAVALKAKYQATIDGTDGDVTLKRVDTSFLRTAVSASGKIAARRGKDGKTTTLDLAVRDGRIEDLLRLFVKGERPPMEGPANIRAHAALPPQIQPFLHQLSLSGDFEIFGGRFEKEATQAKVDQLSERASDDKGKNQDDPPDVESSLSGHAVLQNGQATLSDLVFSIPDAKARVQGTFNLENEKIDLHGMLKTDADFTKVTGGGKKSVLLKPFDAIFRRHPRGAVIPVQLTGTYSDPHPGLDILPKK